MHGTNKALSLASSMPINPYIAGDPISGQFGFFGRDDVFRAVKHILRADSNAIVLYGQRRIGKTSILLQIERQLDDEGLYTPVYFDLHDKASLELEEVLFHLAGTIANKIGLKVPSRQEFDGNGDFFRSRFLEEATIAIGDSKGLVLLLDEFDVLDSPDYSKAGRNFFPYLRSWMTSVKQVHFVFVIGRRPEDLSTNTLATLKGVRSFIVSRFDRETSDKLVKQSEKNGTLVWSDEAVARIWHWTKGHAFFCQLLCSIVWENQEDATSMSQTVYSTHVDDAVSEALRQGANACQWIWDGLPPAERVVVSAISEANCEEISRSDLVEILNRSGVRLIVRELEIAPETLVEWDLLEYVEDHEPRFRFAVPILRRWVSSKRPLRRVKEELDRLDPLAEGLYQTGRHYYGSQQFGEAVDQITRCLNINPNHLKARVLLGRVHLERGNSADAVKVLREGLRYDQMAVRADLIRALLAISDEQNEEQRIKTFSEILEIDSSQPLARERLDQIYEQKRQRGIASKRAKAAELRASGKLDAAIRIYEVLQKQEPHNREWSEQILQTREEYVANLLLEGNDYEDQGEWSLAVRLYEQLLNQYGDIAGLRDCITRVHAKQQMAEKYSRAVSLLAQNQRDNARDLLLEILVEQPNHKEAVARLYEAVHGRPVSEFEEIVSSQLRYIAELESAFNLEELAAEGVIHLELGLRKGRFMLLSQSGLILGQKHRESICEYVRKRIPHTGSTKWSCKFDGSLGVPELAETVFVGEVVRHAGTQIPTVRLRSQPSEIRCPRCQKSVSRSGLMQHLLESHRETGDL